ncbi:hypothetical protein JCM6292_386 [Bacteroides pyogenes JCM 6292]|uniref:Uncharacterized protein n=2 Tax=Bacteroides pyogenes TaxID=310300 RepID=W4PE34_9BACE|nr:hypothetical protein JCM6292_386 [Bacteroides pyogenes JCM 6292]GAE18037.1 hypothetical protein JCM6294_874 [Bacteroides pyogenes DSM 20611 = JCM 6294]
MKQQTTGCYPEAEFHFYRKNTNRTGGKHTPEVCRIELLCFLYQLQKTVGTIV